MAEDKITDSNRKPTPNNIPPTSDENKKRPKFNIYWIYGIAFAALIGYNFYRGVGRVGVETDQIKFKEMVKMGDVEKIKTVRMTFSCKELCLSPLARELQTQTLVFDFALSCGRCFRFGPLSKASES